MPKCLPERQTVTPFFNKFRIEKKTQLQFKDEKKWCAELNHTYFYLIFFFDMGH